MGRIEAARRGYQRVAATGRTAEGALSVQDDYERAIRRAIGRKPFLRSQGRYLTREQAHDRARLR